MKTMKKTSKLKEMITKKGVTTTKKKTIATKGDDQGRGERRRQNSRKTITRKGTTKIRKKTITTEGDEQDQEEINKS